MNGNGEHLGRNQFIDRDEGGHAEAGTNFRLEKPRMAMKKDGNPANWQGQTAFSKDVSICAVWTEKNRGKRDQLTILIKRILSESSEVVVQTEQIGPDVKNPVSNYARILDISKLPPGKYKTEFRVKNGEKYETDWSIRKGGDGL